MKKLARGSMLEAVSDRPKAYGIEPIAAANNRFGRYKKEEVQEVRKPSVTAQSYVERARRTRQMLRSMTAEQLLQIIEFHVGLNFFEALELARKEDKMIVPNSIHDILLTESKDGIILGKPYSSFKLTGTLVIYEEPDKPFGELVVFNWDRFGSEYFLSFLVPKQFQGKSNCAFAIEHPDFEVVDLGNNRYDIRVSDETNIRLIGQFPRTSYGWHIPDTETKIPQGVPLRIFKEAWRSEERYLLRVDGAYIGPLVRDADIGGPGGTDKRRYIYAHYGSYGRFGVGHFGAAVVSVVGS